MAGAAGHVTPDVTIGAHGAQLEQTTDFDLADALAGEIQYRAHFFERNSTAIGDVKRACLSHLGQLFVRKVELDAAGFRIHIQNR